LFDCQLPALLLLHSFCKRSHENKKIEKIEKRLDFDRKHDHLSPIIKKCKKIVKLVWYRDLSSQHRPQNFGPRATLALTHLHIHAQVVIDVKGAIPLE
jgi:hypothetical protein